MTKIHDWSTEDVANWLRQEIGDESIISIFRGE
jgi:hypothetical protein